MKHLPILYLTLTLILLSNGSGPAKAECVTVVDCIGGTSLAVTDVWHNAPTADILQ